MAKTASAMWSIGFGLEKLGLVASAPSGGLHAVLLLVFVVRGLRRFPKVRFDGDVTAILPENSEAYRNYFDNRERFRDFARDLTILVESDRLITASGLEDLRFLQLELAVTPRSPTRRRCFRFRWRTGKPARLGQFFPEEIQSDEDARQPG